MNIGNGRGFILNREHLEAHLALNNNPTFVALTETLLEGKEGHKETVVPELTGYTLVSQRTEETEGREAGLLFLCDRSRLVVLTF